MYVLEDKVKNQLRVKSNIPFLSIDDMIYNGSGITSNNDVIYTYIDNDREYSMYRHISWVVHFIQKLHLRINENS